MASRSPSRALAASRAVARFQAAVLLTLVYFAVVPLAAWIRVRDPLGTRRDRRDSYWLPHQPVAGGLDRHTHPF